MTKAELTVQLRALNDLVMDDPVLGPHWLDAAWQETCAAHDAMERRCDVEES